MFGIWQNCWREYMSVELTRADPVLIFLEFAFAFWMRRRPDLFARFFSLRWFEGFLIGGNAEKEQRNPPPWLVSILSWVGLVGILGAIAEMGIWLALIAKGFLVY
jgi:hypothetical protein